MSLRTPLPALVLLLPLVPPAALAQEARLRPAPEISLPTDCDGNSPSFWLDGRLHLFSSIGTPVNLSVAASLFGDWETRKVHLRDLHTKALWIESAWAERSQTVFGWYHHEPGYMYPDSHLTAPKIGALISIDGGRSVYDLGFILESGDELHADARNGFFVGGHGDFSVILDRERRYFYFFFTNYGGAPETQGVCVARMAYADRFEPEDKVFKYYQGGWNEPGIGGRVTPIFPAVRGWEHADPDSFWGPSVHWNTHLNGFVMLLNHARGEPGWSQHGIHITFATDLANPRLWKTPTRILDDSQVPSWSTFYPQVMGLEPGGTDSVAGKVARFFLHGVSRWEIEFERPPPAEPVDEHP